MRLRRMRRTADLVDLINDLESYGSSLKNKLEGVLKSYNDQKEKIETSIGELNSAPVPEKNDKGREVKRSIMNLVNGEGDFPGLSELPETEDYGKTYDRIVTEYNNLKVKKTQRNLDGLASDSEKALLDEYNGGKQKIAEVINNITQWNLKKALDDFIGVLKDQYGADYANGWKPLEQAIVDINDEYVGILGEFQKLFGGMFRKENLGEFKKLLDGYGRNLIQDGQDLNYYRKQFKDLYKGNPPDYEKKSYEEVMKAFDGVFENMQSSYEWLTEFNEVIDEHAEILKRNTSGKSLSDEVQEANAEEFDEGDERPGM